MNESENTNKTNRTKSAVRTCIILVAVVLVFVICIRYIIIQHFGRDGVSGENSAVSGTENNSETVSADKTDSAAETSDNFAETEILEGMTVKHLADVNIVYPDNYFDSSSIAQPDEDVTSITLKGANEISVLYVAELSNSMLLSGFPDYILNQYSEIIKENYGISDYTEYEWNSMQMRRYDLSDNKTAFVYTGESYALYMEVVTNGTAGAVEQALSYILQK